MVNLGNRLLRLAALVTAALWTLAAPACNVPVFRYALERWEADPYEVIVFQREPLTAEQQALLERLAKAGRDDLANLSVSRVNVSAEMPQPLRELWSAQANPTLPWMVVKYPRKTEIELPAWAGPLSAETVGALLESPVRRDIAQRMLRGDAVVWLLLESGDQRRDDQAAQLVEGRTPQAGAEPGAARTLAARSPDQPEFAVEDRLLNGAGRAFRPCRTHAREHAAQLEHEPGGRDGGDVVSDLWPRPRRAAGDR